MPIYEVAPEPEQPQYDAGVVADWLTANGVVVTSVRIKTTPGQGLVYVIESDIDPTAAIATFAPGPTEREAAATTLTTLKPSLADGTATLDDVRDAVAALAILAGF